MTPFNTHSNDCYLEDQHRLTWTLGEKRFLFKIIWYPFTNAGWWNCHPGHASRDRHHSTRGDHISTFLTCSTQEKDNCIRPVDVGKSFTKCLQRTISKTITGLLKEDIISTVGTLQTMCKTGIRHKKAAIHMPYGKVLKRTIVNAEDWSAESVPRA